MSSGRPEKLYLTSRRKTVGTADKRATPKPKDRVHTVLYRGWVWELLGSDGYIWGLLLSVSPLLLLPLVAFVRVAVVAAAQPLEEKAATVASRGSRRDDALKSSLSEARKGVKIHLCFVLMLDYCCFEPRKCPDCENSDVCSQKLTLH
jgi:hypothetical protein